MSPLKEAPGRAAPPLLAAVALVTSGLFAAGCTDERRVYVTETSSTAPATTSLQAHEDLPGVVLDVLAVEGGGGGGPQANLRVGDPVAVTFAVYRRDGTRLPLAELDTASVLLSGPTFSYQPVLGLQTDVKARATENPDGTYTYVFADALPAAYPAPANDTQAFGALDGELQGQALLSGTYTVGLLATKDYDVAGETYVDAGSATRDVLLGDATSFNPRQVVSDATCARCHVEVRAHGDRRVGVQTCVLCHTAGAEDRNTPGVESGTPGVSIDFRVLVHRIHNGAHLPSVLGVQSASDGSRTYTMPPRPYVVVGWQDRVRDFSEHSFPVMPSAYVAYVYDQAGTAYRWAAGNGPMPRDVGYAALAPADRLAEDRIRTGAVACAACHGDPDGAGPAAAPSQGDVAFAQPSRRACGACHDDVDWTHPYQANGQTMPPQPDDSACITCHARTGSGLAVEDAHRHPYGDPALNTGVNVSIAAVTSGGTTGALQPGAPVTATFTVRNDAGVDVPIHSLTRFQLIAVGPTTNPQVILGNVNVFDFAFRKSTPFTGSGTISTPTVAASAPQQTLGVVFTAANVFDVVGSASGTLASGVVVPDGGGNTGDLSYAGVTFRITDASTNFAAGDRFYLEVVPVQASYTLAIPWDVARERLGAATGGADSLPVANPPHAWGRQVVWERTAVLAGSTLGTAAALFQPYVVVDAATVPGVAVNDVVVVGAGTADEEYVQVGRIQTTDDRTGADLGPQDRLWFADRAFLRFPHAAGTAIAEATLTSRREGIDYAFTSGGVDLVAGRFAAGNPVVISYRSPGRFGWVPAPGRPRYDLYLPAPADEDPIDESWGDWRGLPLLSGTYTVGAWANIDFTLDPLGAPVAVEAWNRSPVTDNTTYRMISPPATRQFLFGTATTLAGPRAVIADYDTCNRCHGDLQAHGFGRRGLETCLLCHAVSGVEDGTKRSFASWYVSPTPGVTMDFRTMLHKVHMGGDLSSPYTVNGVFLANPYAVEPAGEFPAAGGGAARCDTCHGASASAWEPGPRDHPSSGTPVRTWRAVCASCHDSVAAQAHIDAQTGLGVESCTVCHGLGGIADVRDVHRAR